MVFRRSLGTIAYGSLAIPSVFVMKAIHNFLKPSFSKIDRRAGASNGSTKIDRFGRRLSFIMRAINPKLWVEVGRSGKEFCEAAEAADKLYNFGARYKWLI
jgi:hypothetical protein